MNDIKCVHFVGIGGAGMSALAQILLEKGFKVTGSDISFSKYTERLSSLGACISIGHSPANLPPNCELVVVSSAIPESNPEIIEAASHNIKIIKRAELLAELMLMQKGIAVAGAHGKTTTSSMISYILERAEFDPTIVVGGELCNLSSNAKLGRGEYLVAEADESDGTFLLLKPHTVVVTNIEDDHLDYYGNKEKIIEAFQQFLNNVQVGGKGFLCGDDESVLSLKRPNGRDWITYGLQDTNNIIAKNINLGTKGCGFDIYYHKKALGRLELSLTGQHNIVNALGAMAVALDAGVPFQEACQYLKEFRGVERRFQLLGNYANIKVIDDYAHHPTEIKATLQAARQTHPGRLVAIFQPHRYTRTKQLYREFGESFSNADLLIITDVYSAGEKPIPGVTGELIFQEAKEKYPDKQITYLDTDKLTDYLLENAKPGDMILTLGAGNIWKIGVEFLKKLGA
ncbi:MAG: UDP-N-acetylmuramate--L-alanine ligase [Bacillota bacterium]